MNDGRSSKDSTENKGTGAPADPLVTALARLNRSLDTLSAAISDASERASKARNADEASQLMSEDRATLARQLDSTEARSRKLAEVNKEVSRRLVGAMETVRVVLDSTAK